MMQTLIYILPQETWICFLLLAGFLMMFGFRKAAAGLVGTIVLLAIFSPFIDALVASLPTWVLAVIMFFFAMSLIRLIFGRFVADYVVAHLLYDLIVMPFRFIGWLFRGPGRRI